MSKSRTFRLCSIALLSALSIVVNAYSINITNDISISFTYLVSFISGVFLGPIAGFSVGCIGDIIGCIIAPKGPYAITLTISCGLMGVLPWLVFKLFKKLPKYLKIVISFALVFLVCSVFINTSTWYVMYSSKSEYFAYLISRNSVQIWIVLINCIIMCALFTPIEKLLSRFGITSVLSEKEEINSLREEKSDSTN